MTYLTRYSLLTLIATVMVSFALPASAQDIWTAAAEGDRQSIRQMLKEGQDVNAQDPNLGYTPLIAAVVGNQPKTVRLLARNDADVSTGTGDGNTPLHAAAFLGYDRVVNELLRAGADPLQPNSQGQTPKQVATTDWQTTQAIASMLQIELVEADVMSGREKATVLIDKAVAKRAKSDIWLSILTSNAKNVKKLVRRVDDINALHQTLRTSLISLAAVQGDADIVDILAQAGADVNVRTDDGATPLLLAAFFGRVDAVKVLLKHGADKTLSNNDGTTPLFAAQADMSIVDYVAGLFNIELDYDAVIEGKQAAVTLLSEG